MEIMLISLLSWECYWGRALAQMFEVLDFIAMSCAYR